MSSPGSIQEHLPLLRQTFEHHLVRSQENTSETTKMIRGQGLPQSVTKDLLIIALHAQGDHRDGKGNDYFQVGLSIFDTRHFASAAMPSPPQQSPLVTREFFLSSDKRSTRNSWRFCFGESGQQSTLDGFRQEYQKAIADRNFILIFNSGSGYDRVSALLTAANIDLHPQYVIDIPKATEEVFPAELGSSPSMERMLELLKCPFDTGMLRNAGNYANFTLRAFLLLAAADLGNHQALGLSLERLGRDFVPVEDYREREKKSEVAKQNRTQSRIQRRDERFKEAEERAKKWLPRREAARAAQREAEDMMDKSFDETTARTLAGWWKMGNN